MSDIKSDKSEVLHYDNPDFPVFIRKNYITFGMELNDTSIHWHDEAEFIYVLRGDIDYLVDGERFRMQRGEGVFVNSRHLHRILNGTSDCELLCLIFSPMLLCATKYIAVKYVQPILEAGNLSYLFLSDKIEWQKAVLGHIHSIYQSSISQDAEMEVIAHVYRLWQALAGNVLLPDLGKVREDDELMRVRMMIEFIQSKYEEPVSLKDICENGNMGKNKCTALFKKYTNMSPVDYLRHYRVEKSMELLKDSDMTVTEIAYATGFSGASFYAETFRKYIGYSPIQYREKTRRYNHV